MARARTVAVVVPSPAASFVLLATSWTRLRKHKQKRGIVAGRSGGGSVSGSSFSARARRSSEVGRDEPGAEVLELVLEDNRLGDTDTVCERA
jgi:hypothetical protein